MSTITLDEYADPGLAPLPASGKKMIVAAADEIYKRDSLGGNTPWGGGTSGVWPPANTIMKEGTIFATLALAIADWITSVDPDVQILVGPGEYNETSLTIPQECSIRGAGQDKTRIVIAPTSQVTMEGCYLYDLWFHRTEITSPGTLLIGANFRTNYLNNCFIEAIGSQDSQIASLGDTSVIKFVNCRTINNDEFSSGVNATATIEIEGGLHTGDFNRQSTETIKMLSTPSLDGTTLLAETDFVGQYLDVQNDVVVPIASGYHFDRQDLYEDITVPDNNTLVFGGPMRLGIYALNLGSGSRAVIL